MREDQYVAGNPALAGSARMIVLTGCSGGGKSSLLAALAGLGYAIRPEAGRQIVKEQLAIGGRALPWDDEMRFADLLMSRAMHQFNSVAPDGPPVVFDRSLVDIAAHFAFLGKPAPAELQRAVALYRYAPRVFVTPPWQAIFTTDSERRKPFAQAVAEYEALVSTYRALGYRLVMVPQLSIAERVAFFVAQTADVSR